jgi:hypothetical protein
VAFGADRVTAAKEAGELVDQGVERRRLRRRRCRRCRRRAEFSRGLVGSPQRARRR